MKNEKYKGFSNYATWRIAKKYFDGFDLCVGMGYYTQEDIDELDPSDLKNDLQELVEVQFHSETQGVDTKVLDFAMAFISDVNWKEVAEYFIAIAKKEFEGA
jgi:hypothetical protein